MSGILNSTYNNVSFALSRHTQALLLLQERAATGSRINRPSDDPSSSYEILGLNSQQRSLETYMANLDDIAGTLEISLSTMQSMVSAVTEAKVNLSQISSGIYDDESRERTADAIDSILEQLVQLANTKHLDSYIFSGASTSEQPYSVSRTDGVITSVSYQGSQQERRIGVAPGVQSSPYYTGSDLFCGDSREAPIFVGETGAKAGTGTSSVTGDVWLTVSGSAGNYSLSIDGGLTAVTTDGTDANLAVTDSVSGKVLYVDTTEITGTGTDLVRIPGTHDVFSTLITVRDILRNEQGLSGAQLEELRAAAASSLDEVNDLLVQNEVSIGYRIGFLSDLKESLENLGYNTEDQANEISQADVAEIAIDLSRRQVLYQMSLSVAGKLMSLSLLDFIS